MAWDDSVNHSAMVFGAKIEYGEADIGTNTVEVPTKLTHICSAIATYQEAAGADTRIFCDRAISASAVTFADTAVADKVFNYMLVGR